MSNDSYRISYKILLIVFFVWRRQFYLSEISYKTVPDHLPLFGKSGLFNTIPAGLLTARSGLRRWSRVLGPDSTLFVA